MYLMNIMFQYILVLSFLEANCRGNRNWTCYLKQKVNCVLGRGCITSKSIATKKGIPKARRVKKEKWNIKEYSKTRYYWRHENLKEVHKMENLDKITNIVTLPWRTVDDRDAPSDKEDEFQEADDSSRFLFEATEEVELQ